MVGRRIRWDRRCFWYRTRPAMSRVTCCHDRGARVAVDALQRAGFEVIYTGIRQTPEAIVAAAVQEAVDAIGLVGVGQDELEIADLAQQRL